MTSGEPTAWALRFDLLTTQAILLIVAARRDVELQPHVHLYLADRYRRLARHHEVPRHLRRAEVLLAKSYWHLKLGGGDRPPPAAALAMPAPRRPTIHTGDWAVVRRRAARSGRVSSAFWFQVSAESP